MRKSHQKIATLLKDICDLYSCLRCEQLRLTAVGHLLDRVETSTATELVLQVGKV
jgi:hypothetical protein